VVGLRFLQESQGKSFHSSNGGFANYSLGEHGICSLEKDEKLERNMNG
jgi:hypothetical protein